MASIGAWNDSFAFEIAKTGLTDRNPAVRRAAASALARIEDDRRSGVLLMALGDEDRSVREIVSESLGYIGTPVLNRTVEALEDPALEDGALRTLEKLHVAARAADIRSYARNRVTKALQYHHLWQQAITLTGTHPRAQLLADSLRHTSEHQGINALRAVGVLDESDAVSIAIDSLRSTDPVQRANAVETLDSIADRDIVRPALRLWEPADESSPAYERVPPEQALRQSLQDPDPWLRACAALAALNSDSGEIRAQLEQLAQSDSDSMVRETATAALEENEPMQTLDTLSLMERILFLKRVPLFANLPPAEVKQVAAIADEHLFGDGEIIAEQNEAGDELYVIISGQVRVSVNAEDQQDVELALRGVGEYVGEMAVISRKPRMARLVAVGDVRALCIGQRQFEGMLRERPETSLAVMRELCERLRERENATQT